MWLKSPTVTRKKRVQIRAGAADGIALLVCCKRLRALSVLSPDSSVGRAPEVTGSVPVWGAMSSRLMV